MVDEACEGQAEAAGIGCGAADCSGSEGALWLAIGTVAGHGCVGAGNAAQEMVLLICLRLSV